MFMHSTHNDFTSIVAERFIKTLKDKNNEKVAGNYSKSHLVYLNGLVDKHNNNYHRFISKKSVDVGYSPLSKEIELSHKASKLNVGYRVRIFF